MTADLEAAIVAAIEENLDDPAPYLVYADYLQSIGDPRGELRAVSPGRARGGQLVDPRPLRTARRAALRFHAAEEEAPRALLDRQRVAPRLPLDLSMGAPSDDAVAWMATMRDTFAHLEHLNLDDNALTQASRPLVQGLAQWVHFGNRQEPDRAARVGADRDTSVG